MERPIEKWLFVMLFFLIPSLTFAQKQITGVVKSAVNGDPIEGVSILRNNIPLTASNSNGEFEISANVGDSLSFTSVGLRRLTQVVDERNILEILLYEDGSDIDEVTVVAFGTQKNHQSSVLLQPLKQPISEYLLPI